MSNEGNANPTIIQVMPLLEPQRESLGNSRGECQQDWVGRTIQLGLCLALLRGESELSFQKGTCKHVSGMAVKFPYQKEIYEGKSGKAMLWENTRRSFDVRCEEWGKVRRQDREMSFGGNRQGCLWNTGSRPCFFNLIAFLYNSPCICIL